MQNDSSFERSIGRIPEPFKGAAIDVTDTLELAWKAVQAVFGGSATPEQAINVTALMLQAAGRIPAAGAGTP
jgi:hypothetical protein